MSNCPLCQGKGSLPDAPEKCPKCGAAFKAEDSQTQPTEEPADLKSAPTKAASALVCSLFGLLVLGFVLGPAAIVMGMSANATLREHGRPSSGKASAALIFGVIASVIGLAHLALIIYNIATKRYPPAV